MATRSRRRGAAPECTDQNDVTVDVNVAEQGGPPRLEKRTFTVCYTRIADMPVRVIEAEYNREYALLRSQWEFEKGVNPLKADWIARAFAPGGSDMYAVATFSDMASARQLDFTAANLTSERLSLKATQEAQCLGAPTSTIIDVVREPDAAGSYQTTARVREGSPRGIYLKWVVGLGSAGKTLDLQPTPREMEASRGAGTAIVKDLIERFSRTAESGGPYDYVSLTIEFDEPEKQRGLERFYTRLGFRTLTRADSTCVEDRGAEADERSLQRGIGPPTRIMRYWPEERRRRFAEAEERAIAQLAAARAAEDARRRGAARPPLSPRQQPVTAPVTVPPRERTLVIDLLGAMQLVASGIGIEDAAVWDALRRLSISDFALEAVRTAHATAVASLEPACHPNRVIIYMRDVISNRSDAQDLLGAALSTPNMPLKLPEQRPLFRTATTDGGLYDTAASLYRAYTAAYGSSEPANEHLTTALRALAPTVLRHLGERKSEYRSGRSVQDLLQERLDAMYADLARVASTRDTVFLLYGSSVPSRGRPPAAALVRHLLARAVVSATRRTNYADVAGSAGRAPPELRNIVVVPWPAGAPGSPNVFTYLAGAVTPGTAFRDLKPVMVVAQA
jgi:hypothetical protein